MAFAAPKQSDLAVEPGPSDTPQDLSWSPTANHLCVGSWDSTIKVYDIQPTGQVAPIQEFTFGGPVLGTAFNGDGSQVFGACTDKSVQACDLKTGQLQQIGAHDAPVKTVNFLPSMNAVMTGSWDKTLKFWDQRSPNPIGSFTLPERIYSADSQGQLAVAATADNQVTVYSLGNGPQQYSVVPTNLKMQTRCISCFPDGSGFAIGSIEGRCAIQYADQAQKSKNFSFKCHRDAKNIFCVNDLAFHPGYGTFATVGSDGNYVFWDKDNRNRLKTFDQAQAQITCAGFNGDGSLFAYGYGYDWSKGAEHFNAQGAKGIMIHAVRDDEVKPKKA